MLIWFRILGVTKKKKFCDHCFCNKFLSISIDCVERSKKKEEIKWDKIAKDLYTKTGVFRTGKLCRERWKNYLDPELKKYDIIN